jgi:secondary thiamine-phosphate synthase enzyme
MSRVEVVTERGVEARDITQLVQRAARVVDGVVWVSCPHTTTAVLVNEADEDLLRDLERMARTLLDPLEPFSHARRGNPNASAHLMAALLGGECLVRVSGGELALGPHQRVLLLELDGPKSRQVDVHPLITATEEILS